MMGTFQIALVAHSMNKPVYVAAEIYNFARLYPLDQKDLVPALRPIDFGVSIPSKVEVETSALDYVPPQYLTLFFTYLGVPTPSVVSDELIQLYLANATKPFLRKSRNFKNFRAKFSFLLSFFFLKFHIISGEFFFFLQEG